MSNSTIRAVGRGWQAGCIGPGVTKGAMAEYESKRAIYAAIAGDPGSV